MPVVGCIWPGKYLSGICLVGKVSVRDVPGWGNVRRTFVWSGKCPLGMCLVGEVSFVDVSGRGRVRRGCVWSRKCPSGMCLVGEMSVGEVSFGEESVEETSVGNVSGNRIKICQSSALFPITTKFAVSQGPAALQLTFRKIHRKTTLADY